MMPEMWTLLTSFAVCAAMGPVLIPFMHRLKFGQSIRECGPQNHVAKSGTPTMGGIMIIAAVTVAMLIWGPLSHQVFIALLLFWGHALIGFIDDYIKVVKKRNLGLTAKQKFLLQFVLAATYVAYAEKYLGDTRLLVPGMNVYFDLGWAYYFLVLILLVGTTNAVNLTDGLDGLVSFVSLPVLFVFALLGADVPGVSSFACAVFGACVGFLLFNHYPAKIFMGDTGSLALGGALAAMALLTKTELFLIILGGVYVAEAASVILQVASFRLRNGKRIFRMSPLHHHFELGGWKETKVVAVFTLISVALSAFTYFLFTR